jgi:hypothetical protein
LVAILKQKDIETLGEAAEGEQTCKFYHELSPDVLLAITVAAYIEQHPGSPPTVKQHMAAIRMLFSWLTEKRILAMNPAREVKTQKFSRLEGERNSGPSQTGGIPRCLSRSCQALGTACSPFFRSTCGRSRELAPFSMF